jgi:hypothetical protein
MKGYFHATADLFDGWACSTNRESLIADICMLYYRCKRVSCMCRNNRSSIVGILDVNGNHVNGMFSGYLGSFPVTASRTDLAGEPTCNAQGCGDGNCNQGFRAHWSSLGADKLMVWGGMHTMPRITWSSSF